MNLGAFSSRFQGDAVQYFYEPFLAAYDPELRKQFGVWYTPADVVEYMVERVDQSLREDLGLGLGLADPSVYVLDPATGTGSYLTAALGRIERTLRAQPDWDDASADELKKAATQRLFGFEIMPAPYVIAHMRMGQRLARSGAALEGQERAAIYLTNALTNWHSAPPRLDMPELQAEQDAAQTIKQESRIIVVMGNPPYGAFAGVATKEEGNLIKKYKAGLKSKWKIGKYNLDELYVRFFRIAERRIGISGKGIVCYITPYSYVSDVSFVVMRQNLISEFNIIRIDNVNGDSRETGKKTPEGKPDPSIFSTKLNPEGITSGIAISLLVKSGNAAESKVQYREFWGAGKAEALRQSLSAGGPAYEQAHPTAENRYSLKPIAESGEYGQWVKVVDLAGEKFIQGMDEDRAGALMDMQRESLIGRMRAYFDKSLPFEQFAEIGGGLARDSARFIPQKARETAQARERFDENAIKGYIYRPFDTRAAYITLVPTVWKHPRPEYQAQNFSGGFFVTRSAAAAADEGIPFYFTTDRIARDALKGHAVVFPILLNSTSAQSNGLFADAPTSTRANLSPLARTYLSALGAPDPDSLPQAAVLLWHHALAVGFSAAYLTENAAGVAADWPRIPLPATLEALQESARLGARVAELLDNPHAETAPELGAVGRLKKVDAAAAAAQGYEVRADWGRRQPGKVMPGRGRVQERAASDLPSELGGRVLDVSLNDGWVWENVPLSVWEYTIGGYQVVKKWLSYREFGVLGRALTLDEAREVSRMARRLAELVRLGPELDTNYARVRGNVWASAKS